MCAHVAVCQAATLAHKQQFLASFPEVLLVQVSRFTFENWVPQKLCVQIGGLANADGEAPPLIDFSLLQTRARDPNETIVDENGGSGAGGGGEHADPAIVLALEQMGFPRVQCERAAFESKNVGAGEPTPQLGFHFGSDSWFCRGGDELLVCSHGRWNPRCKRDFSFFLFFFLC